MQRQIRSNFEKALLRYTLFLIVTVVGVSVAVANISSEYDVWIALLMVMGALFGFCIAKVYTFAAWLQRMDENDYPVIVNFKDEQ